MVTIHCNVKGQDSIYTYQFPDTIFALRFVADNIGTLSNITSDSVYFLQIYNMWKSSKSSQTSN